MGHSRFGIIGIDGRFHSSSTGLDNFTVKFREFRAVDTTAKCRVCDSVRVREII